MRLAAFGLLVPLLLAPCSGRAQENAPVEPEVEGGDRERARVHFEAGTSYYEQGRYEEAANEFLESHRR